MTTTAWVIGARGLLGRALARAVDRKPGWDLLAAESLPWSDDDDLRESTRRNATNLMHAAAESGGEWAVLWAAGVVVTSGQKAEFDHELSQLSLILDTIAEVCAREAPCSAGVIFYASSAGGVYGGSAHPPFTELTMPVPISGYGRFKLDAEALVNDFSCVSGVSAVTGRISNLYGPGQRLDKLQGLISHLAKTQLSPTSAGIYVPLDTMRDYIYVHDCADLICDTVARCAAETRHHGTIRVVKNLASGVPVTVASLLGLFRALGKKRPKVTLGTSPLASMQAVDLRVTSVVWPELDKRELTPLPAGVRATLDDVLLSVQAGPRK